MPAKYRFHSFKEDNTCAEEVVRELAKILPDDMYFIAWCDLDSDDINVKFTFSQQMQLPMDSDSFLLAYYKERLQWAFREQANKLRTLRSVQGN